MLNKSMTFAALLQDARRWFALMAAVLALGALWIWLSAVPTTGTTGGLIPSPRPGFLAPDFTLDLLGGGQVTLSDLRGEVVMINLWASWCPPCRAEMPAIESVYEDNKALGLQVLAVDMTYQDNESAAASFVQQYGLTFPILMDRTGTMANRYQMRALPTTFFVDRQGVIADVVVGGPMNEALIRTKVEALLAEAP